MSTATQDAIAAINRWAGDDGASVIVQGFVRWAGKPALLDGVTVTIVHNVDGGWVDMSCHGYAQSVNVDGADLGRILGGMVAAVTAFGMSMKGSQEP